MSKLLIGSGQLAEAAAALAPAMGQIPLQLRFEALQQWLNALEFVSNDARGKWRLEQFDEVISANKRDFDSRFAKELLIALGQWTEAMEELLAIIMRDKMGRRGAAQDLCRAARAAVAAQTEPIPLQQARTPAASRSRPRSCSSRTRRPSWSRVTAASSAWR